jgi:hypothetical protein
MNIFNKIKEVINFEITNVKKDILEYEHLTEFGDDFYKPGDCINHILNAKDVLSEYQKILDFVLKREKENPCYVFQPTPDETPEELQKRIDESFYPLKEKELN